MELKERLLITFCISLFFLVAQGQDVSYLKVHFLYGSKPLKQYKATEKKWFGGILGGHVGIESDSNTIINFVPTKKGRWFASRKIKHSVYLVHTPDKFYRIMGGSTDSAKKAVVFIPVTSDQKQKFDSISNAYLKASPYDYAFFGMRCGAASYEILGQLGILPAYSYRHTYRKIFYPRKLRKRLFKKAEENHWTIFREEGSRRRKWEKD